MSRHPPPVPLESSSYRCFATLRLHSPSVPTEDCALPVFEDKSRWSTDPSESLGTPEGPSRPYPDLRRRRSRETVLESPPSPLSLCLYSCPVDPLPTLRWDVRVEERTVWVDVTRPLPDYLDVGGVWVPLPTFGPSGGLRCGERMVTEGVSGPVLTRPLFSV